MRAALRWSTLALPVLAACIVYQPPATTAATRAPTEIAASFGRTWDAVIDEFAEMNIPIQTLERASGFIAAEPLALGTADTTWADCGTALDRIPPSRAYYNVRVLGDSTHSSARVTVRWTAAGAGQGAPMVVECSTTGTWEAAFEQAIKANAEGKVAG
jgi:hypothetical protein